MAGMLGGGALVLLGLFTRPLAFLPAGEMAVAYFIAHTPQGVRPVLNQGELALFDCFTAQAAHNAQSACTTACANPSVTDRARCDAPRLHRCQSFAAICVFSF